MKKFFVRGGVFAVSLIVLSLLAASAANAQTLTGSITGQATDAQGAALAGVKVTVSSKALIGGSQTTTTDASGSYTFNLLPPGGYDVKFEMQGFKAFSRTGIEINAAFVATVNATLEIGAMTETVTITGEAPVIDNRRCSTRSCSKISPQGATRGPSGASSPACRWASSTSAGRTGCSRPASRSMARWPINRSTTLTV
jgi:hypothetical protein